MLKEWRWAEEEVPGSRLTDRATDNSYTRHRDLVPLSWVRHDVSIFRVLFLLMQYYDYRCPVSTLLTYEIQRDEATKSVRNQRATSAEIAAESWSEERPETERDKKPE